MPKKINLKDKNTLELEKIKEEKEDRRRFIFFLLIFLTILFISTFGITVSFYKGGSKEPQEIETDDNPVVTPTPLPHTTASPNSTKTPIPANDNIVFTYSDVDKGGSGINILNAVPISDIEGKVLTGSGKYFDFSVTATSKKHDLLYKILVNKNVQSTLADSDVKLYLTSLSGGFETELVLNTVDKLETIKINNTEYYVLYQKKLEKGVNNYNEQYRLRMWVKENAQDFDNKNFMIKVDVAAEQVGD